ncbi:MAG: ABC transporter permease [Planctomycetes bacterium]|nr:ABC transporter permease [Planctomycetota bacterium]
MSSYQSLLTRRYLTSKIMPLLAALAVTLCTATVLVVWSVMGGFLVNLIENGRTLTGDVKIDWPTAGFAHYQDLIQRLEADPLVAAAAPAIETVGMLTLPDGRTEHAAIIGVEAASFARVTGYADALWWRPIDKPLPKDKQRQDWRLQSDLQPHFSRDTLERLLEDGIRLTEIDPRTGERVSAVALGIDLSRMNIRLESGVYVPGRTQRKTPEGEVWVDVFLPEDEVVIGVPVFDRRGNPYDYRTRRMPVANEFMTGMYMVDSSWVVVDLPALQRMLNMHETVSVAQADPFAVEVDPETGQERFAPPATTGINPSRVTTVYVKAALGYHASELAARCKAIYADFAADHEGDVPDAQRIAIATWEEQHAVFIGAVKKEIVLVMFIFGVISLTSIFLVLAIFWAMISEKTRDIGVLRALGASRGGIAWLWLRYGLAIGIGGSLLGGALAWLIVTNINPIHDSMITMGRMFDQNWAIWDPRIYVFTEIPNDMELSKAVTIMLGGIVASVLGALWPALRAARMDPVKSLRFE